MRSKGKFKHKDVCHSMTTLSEPRIGHFKQHCTFNGAASLAGISTTDPDFTCTNPVSLRLNWIPLKQIKKLSVTGNTRFAVASQSVPGCKQKQRSGRDGPLNSCTSLWFTTHWFFHSQEWSSSIFSRDTSYSMENLAIDSLLRWKLIEQLFLTTSLNHFLLELLGTFAALWAWDWKG